VETETGSYLDGKALAAGANQHGHDASCRISKEASPERVDRELILHFIKRLGIQSEICGKNIRMKTHIVMPMM
jgi:hypothetical protein